MDVRRNCWLAVMVVVVAAGGVRAAEDEQLETAGAHRVIGTLGVTRSAEAALDGSEWKPLGTGAVLEGMQIRTGAKGAVTVQLASGDMIALGPDSACQLGSADKPGVELRKGRMALRVHPGSPLEVTTPRGRVRSVALGDSSPDGLNDALVTVNAENTALRSYRGGFVLLAAGEHDGITVDAGQVAMLGPQSTKAALTLAAATSPANEKSITAADEDLLGALGSTPLLLGLLGAGAVGGTVGGLAASGTFSGSSTDSTTGAGREGSPFRPVRR
jgi:hypothetical protein